MIRDPKSSPGAVPPRRAPRTLLAATALLAVAAASGTGAPDPAVTALIRGDLAPVLTPAGAGRFSNLDIRTSSMRPALRVGDLATVDHRAYDAAPAARGDVVAFRPTVAQAAVCGGGGIFVKRVVAVAGDTVEVRGGQVLVGGAPLVVAGAEAPAYEMAARTVPAGSVFVLGDVRNASCDGHQWPQPFVSAGRIIGRVDAVLFPRSHAGLLPATGGVTPVDLSDAPARPRLDFAVILGRAATPVLARTADVRGCAVHAACVPRVTGRVHLLGQALVGMRRRVAVAAAGLDGDCAAPVARRLDTDLFRLAAAAGRARHARPRDAAVFARDVDRAIARSLSRTAACWAVPVA